MMILKSQTYQTASLIAEFVNVNGIKRENIYSIIAYTEVDLKGFAIYFYGESDVKEKTKSLFGWS